MLLGLLYLFLQLTCMQASQPNSPLLILQTKQAALEQTVQAQATIDRILNDRDLTLFNVPRILENTMPKYPLVNKVKVQDRWYINYPLNNGSFKWVQFVPRDCSTKTNSSSPTISSQNSQTAATQVAPKKFRATRRDRSNFLDDEF